MTRKQRVRKEIDFANMGAGSYLCDCLWDMMEDHNLTWEDFRDKTKAWKKAVENSACEAYEFMPYEDLWERIIASSLTLREEEKNTEKQTVENIREFLITKIDKFLDKTVTEYSDHLKGGMRRKASIEMSCLLSSGHELSIRDMDFDNLSDDGLRFDRKGKLEV
jgi:hypothetical protein